MSTRRSNSVPWPLLWGALAVTAPSAVIADIPAAAPARRCQNGDFVVAIDVGHSANQPGATSARGVDEFLFNRRLAQEIEAGLHARGLRHAFIVADRSSGPLSLTDRTRIAAKHHADLFLSVHHDSVQPQYLSDWNVDGRRRRYSDRFSGFSLFISALNPHYTESLAFARRIGVGLLKRGLHPTTHHREPIPGENRPLLEPALGLYRFDELAVLRTATMPAVLFEAGIIVHRDDEKRLDSLAYRTLIVDALADAVTDICLGLVPGSESERGLAEQTISPRDEL